MLCGAYGLFPPFTRRKSNGRVRRRYGVGGELARNWVFKAVPPHLMDVNLIKMYFGEQIGFFFAFKQHITTMLTPIAVWGAANAALQARTGSGAAADAYWSAAFAATTALWGVIVLELWKRIEVMSDDVFLSRTEWLPRFIEPLRSNGFELWKCAEVRDGARGSVVGSRRAVSWDGAVWGVAWRGGVKYARGAGLWDRTVWPIRSARYGAHA